MSPNTHSLDGRVLVTGADGFIGSHVVEALADEGTPVRAFCYYNSNGSYGWLDGREDRSNIDFVLGDIRDPDSVRMAVEDCDYIIHLAALIAIPYSYSAPDSYVETNIRGTLNVLQAARYHDVRRVVHTSTSEVYGTPDQLPITEAHTLKGQSPYSASKIGADKMAEAFFASFETPVVTLRPFNTFGPRQSSRAVIPTILSQLLGGRTEIELGSLEPRRDFTFVSDTVQGLLAAASVIGVDGETIHLGTGSAVSIGELFELACEVTGVSATVVSKYTRTRPTDSEVMVLLSDPSKANALLGWSSETSLRDGLAATSEWVSQHLSMFDLNRFHV